MELILAVRQEEMQEAASRGVALAHLAYRIGDQGRLLRYRSAVAPKGGWMVIEGEGTVPSATLPGEIGRERTLRGFTGVLLRLPRRSRETYAPLVRALADLGQNLCLPESYGSLSAAAQVLIPTALSGGSYRERLEEAADRFGRERVALWVERSAEDFFLPSPKGCGAVLSREELERIKMNKTIFFSTDLCSRYFSYREGDRGHFVLFDDGDTLRRKLQIARELGIGRAFLPYGELGEYFNEILNI